MTSYLIVFCFTVQSIFISAIPVFPNNQVPGLPYHPGGFDWKSNLALLLQDSTNNFNPYPPAFNNQFCPCQNQGNNWNILNQPDFNDILNNPIVQNLLGPNYHPKEDEVKIPEQFQNCPVQPKIPSVVNNYIVIPPEAFINSEHEIENNNNIKPATHQITNSNRNAQIKGTRNHRQGRRRPAKRKENSTTASTSTNVKDKDVEVFSVPSGVNKKESLKMRPRKSKSNRNRKPNNGAKGNGDAVQPQTCEAMNVIEENNCFPENHLVNDCNLMNFHQMFPFYPGFPPTLDIDGSQNQCCGNQMMYPDFPNFYNNPYLFNYPQLFNNPNEIINQNSESGIANLCNNRLPVQNKNRSSKKPTPTIILNVKTVNSDAKTELKTNKKEVITHEAIKEDTSGDVIKEKIESVSNKNVTDDKKVITQEAMKKDTSEDVIEESNNGKEEITQEIIKKDNSEDVIKEKTKSVSDEKVANEKEVNTPETLKEDTSVDLIEEKTKSVSKSSEHSAKMKQPNKEPKQNKLLKEVGMKNSSTSITIDSENTTVKNEVDKPSTQKTIKIDNVEKPTVSKQISEDVKSKSMPEVSSEIENDNLHSTELQQDNAEEISVPELGTEDELPTLHENYIIRDYYPDFRNDNKNHDIGDSVDLNNLMDENGHTDISRERRKLKRPLHEYNSLRRHQPTRNYYKLGQDPALNEVSTTEDPKLSKTFTEIETITTVKSSDASEEEVMYFITPPSLDKIDFRTKQINKEDYSSSIEAKEIDNIKEKRVFVNSKSSTFSNAKVPYNMNYKPKKDVFKNSSPVTYVETAYGHSKVATYGRTEEIEDTLDNPINDDSSSESSAEKPFIVMAEPIFE